MKTTKIAIDRLQVRLRGGSAGAARTLGPALGPKLMEALHGARGLRATDVLRVTERGPADAGRIAGAIAEAMQRS